MKITNPDDNELFKGELPKTINLEWDGDLRENYEWGIFINGELRYKTTGSGYPLTFNQEGAFVIKVAEIPKGVE